MAGVFERTVAGERQRCAVNCPAGRMTIPPTGFIRLSSDRFSERDRLEAPREVFGRAIMNVEFEPAPGVPFNMNMVLRTLPDFGLAAGTRSAMTCVRTK